MRAHYHSLCTALVALVAALGADADMPVGPLIAHHSILAPFVGDWWQEGVPHWDIGGDAVVTQRYVRLTPDLPSRYGWAWNTQPNDNLNWEARISFVARHRRATQADGFAFWLISNPIKEGGAGPGPLLGGRSNFQGIGVILDTYDNDGTRDNPSVSLLVNPEGTERDWDTDHDLRSDARGRCTYDFRTSSHQPAELIVTYIHRRLTVKLRNPEKGGGVAPCIDADRVDFPAGRPFYFGLTATTGQITDNHDITAFEVRAIGDSIDDPSIPLEHFDHAKESSDKSFYSKQERTSGHQRASPDL